MKSVVELTERGLEFAYYNTNYNPDPAKNWRVGTGPLYPVCPYYKPGINWPVLCFDVKG